MAEGQSRTLETVRRLLDRIVKRHPDMKDIATEITGLLDGLVAGGTKKTIQRRTGEGVKYRIEEANKRPMLYEMRPAGAPLRVSRDLYAALVSVLAESEKPLSYDEIAEGIEKTSDMKLAEWQGRLLLRFVQTADPPLVIRERSRYRVADANRFTAAAQKLWRSTERS